MYVGSSEIKEKLEFLNDIKFIDMKIKCTSDSIKRCKEDYYTLKSPQYHDVKVQSKRDDSVVEEAAIKLYERKKHLERQLEYFIKLKMQAQEAIDNIPNETARTCLQMVFIENRSIIDFANRYSFTRSGAYNIRNKGAKMLCIPDIYIR